MRGERVLGGEAVVGGLGVEHVDGPPVEPLVRPRRLEQLGPRRLVVERREARVEALALERIPPGRAVEERAELETEEQRDAARRGLRVDVAARGRLGLDAPEDLGVQPGGEVGLADAERHRPSGAAADLGHPVDLAGDVLVVRAVPLEPRRNLEHPALVPAEHVADREQLALVGPRAGNRASVGHPVQQGAARGEPERTGADRLVDEVAHRRDVVVGRDLVAGRGLRRQAALAHHVVAQRAVADHPAVVDALREPVDRAEVLAVGGPVPREAVEDRVAGDVLHRLHELGEVLAFVRCARRERHTAVPEHHARHAVPAAARAERIPGDLRVEVRVDVDEPRRHDLALGIELARAAILDRADGGDAVAVDRDVADPAGRARAVDDETVANDEIVGHGVSMSGAIGSGPTGSQAVREACHLAGPMASCIAD